MMIFWKCEERKTYRHRTWRGESQRERRHWSSQKCHGTKSGNANNAHLLWSVWKPAAKRCCLCIILTVAFGSALFVRTVNIGHAHLMLRLHVRLAYIHNKYNIARRIVQGMCNNSRALTKGHDEKATFTRLRRFTEQPRPAYLIAFHYYERNTKRCLFNNRFTMI